MGKKKKRTNRKVKTTPTASRYTYRRNKVFAVIEMDCGVGVNMRKPRGSRTQDLRNETPNFQRAMMLLGELLQGKDPEIDNIKIPGSEIGAIAQYMADNTLSFTRPIADDDGRDLTWREMGEEERLDFYETLPFNELQHAYGEYTGEVLVDQDPELRKSLDQLREKAEAA